MDDQIEQVMDFIFYQFGEAAELKIGIWDEADEGGHTFYAVIDGTDSGEFANVRIGESTYGSYTIEEALTDLLAEIAEYPTVGSTIDTPA